MKSIIQVFIIIGLATIVSCGGGNSEQKEETIVEEKTPAIEEIVEVKELVNLEDKGIGPVTSITIEEGIDDTMAKNGEELYNQMCSACHKPTVKFIGPAPKDILDRRSPEWVMNMILNPQEMLEQNETAIALLKEHNNVPMTDLGITEVQAREILEYFRTL